ncbi:hypothetical protein Tco_0157258 [Tanacetum coccineum]
MIDGEWVTNPQQVKMTFYNFYNDKFEALDSLMELSPVVPFASLSQEDNIEFQKLVTKEEIRSAVWDCGSQKAPGPDGFSFLLLKTYWELLKEDARKAVRCVTPRQGGNTRRNENEYHHNTIVSI